MISFKFFDLANRMDELAGKKRKLNERNNLNLYNNTSNNNTLNSTNTTSPNPPEPKRPRVNNSAALVRNNALTFRPIPESVGFNNTSNTNYAPPAPLKAPRPVRQLTSAMKGTNPKNRTRRISHTNMPPNVRVFYPLGPGITPGTFNSNKANTNEPNYPMTHINSQTNRYFERYILPKLKGQISDDLINELFTLHTKLMTCCRRKEPYHPDITQRNANQAAIMGIISDHLKNIGPENGNITKAEVRAIPREFANLPEAERIAKFRAISERVSEIFEGKEPVEYTIYKMEALLDAFERFLPPSYVTAVRTFLHSKLSQPVATQGGRKRKSRRVRRNTRKN